MPVNPLPGLALAFPTLTPHPRHVRLWAGALFADLAAQAGPRSAQEKPFSKVEWCIICEVLEAEPDAPKRLVFEVEDFLAPSVAVGPCPRRRGAQPGFARGPHGSSVRARAIWAARRAFSSSKRRFASSVWPPLSSEMRRNRKGVRALPPTPARAASWVACSTQR